MEHEQQRFFFIMVVVILIVNSIILFGVLSILSDHEIARISSGAGINSSPSAVISASRPVTMPKDLRVTRISPLKNSTTGNITTGFPPDLLSDSSSVALTGIQDYPDAGQKSDLVSERSGILAINGSYQENPISVNITTFVSNSSVAIPDDSVMGPINSTGSGSLDGSLLTVQTQNSSVTLVYTEKKRPPSDYIMPKEIPNIAVPLLPIYELKNEYASQVLPEIQYDLNNPPMIIKCNVTPFNITHVKHIEYKELSTHIEEDVVLERPSEMGWFIVSVRNRDTGELVDEVGIGRQYGLQTQHQITIRRPGRYSITIEGFFAKINSFEIAVNRDSRVPFTK